MNNNKIILTVDNVHRTYVLGKTEINVLKGINLEIKQGEWIALLGMSGSGKTTLLNLIGCLENPDTGCILYNNINLSILNKSARNRLRKSKFGFVFQSYHLLPELSVLENVQISAMLNGDKISVAKKKATDMLSLVKLEHRLNHKPGELSGGEQQRTAIARALINDPDLILADEPTGNLDSGTGSEIINLFKDINHNHLKTIIMVTHNQEIAENADRIVVIKDGVISKIDDKRNPDVV